MVMDQEGANESTRENASYANRGDGRAGHQMRHDKCERERGMQKKGVCASACETERKSIRRIAEMRKNKEGCMINALRQTNEAQMGIMG
jgi:hypothetical protein